MRYFALLFACLIGLLAGPAFAVSVVSAHVSVAPHVAVTPHVTVAPHVTAAPAPHVAIKPATMPAARPTVSRAPAALPPRPVLVPVIAHVSSHPNCDGKDHRQDKCPRL